MTRKALSHDEKQANKLDNTQGDMEKLGNNKKNKEKLRRLMIPGQHGEAGNQIGSATAQAQGEARRLVIIAQPLKPL